jgi:hypothetical protein
MANTCSLRYEDAVTARSGTAGGRALPAHRAGQRRVRFLLGSLATALVVALALPWGGAGGRPPATPGSTQARHQVAPHVLYVVQPGDTLWTIAERLAPGGDPRPVEARLAAQVGGDTIVPGERVVLP